MKETRKILAIALSLCMLFQQVGFAQVAGQIMPPAFSYQVLDKFRPIHLRSITFAPGERLNLILDKGDSVSVARTSIADTTRTLMEYFRIGLILPNSTFWVNLRPDAQDRIIDDALARTDIGKVLLEADLNLKKDTALFTSPDTKEGRYYWNKLYEKAAEIYGFQDATVPTLTRPWIVPGEIIIATNAQGAYIYKATLKVCLEQDHLKSSDFYKFDDPRLKTLNDYSSELIRQIILPKLTKEVNNSKKYAGLRQVYYSLILAQWFKNRAQEHKSTGAQVETLRNSIDSNDLTGLTSKTQWSSTEYFNAYRKSFQQGEYNRQEQVPTSRGIAIRQYFSGGAHFAGIAGAITELPLGSLRPDGGAYIAMTWGLEKNTDDDDIYDGGKFNKDWRKLQAEAVQGFGEKTGVYLAVFNDQQKNAFADYMKDYALPRNAVLDGTTIVSDLKSDKDGVMVIGNGLGILSVARAYLDNTLQESRVADGTYKLEDILKQAKTKHAIVITAGGMAKRNPKYTQIGKILATLPMDSKLHDGAATILEPLLDIGVNIEQNYRNEFMFSVIYGDALISFDPLKLRTTFSPNEELRKGLTCLLLEMDYKEAPKYGFVKLQDYNIVEFKEKYTGKDVKKDSEKSEYKGMADDERMRQSLKDQKYLTDRDTILMNPAFATFGSKAFEALAFLAGLTDIQGNIVVKGGKAQYRNKNYLDRAFQGEFGTSFEIDLFGNIVPAFAQVQKKPADLTELERLLVEYRGDLHGVPIEGEWFDTGTGKDETSILLQDEKYNSIVDTYGLKRSIKGQATIGSLKVSPFIYNSRVQAQSGNIHPETLILDSFVKAKTVVMEKGSQLYNVMLVNNIPALHLAENYILSEGAVKRDSRDYVVFLLRDQVKDDVKGAPQLFGGQDMASFWNAQKGLALSNTNNLFKANLFPMVSASLLEQGRPVDKLDEDLLKELPQILEFLQQRTAVAPRSYVQAFREGRTASIEDTYNNPASKKFAQRRALTKALVNGDGGNGIGQIAEAFGLSTIEAAYLRELHKKFVRSQKQTLGIRSLVIGEDFTPSALMSEQDRKDLLGAVEYVEINKAENTEAARNVTLILNPLNGGIGKAVGREAYLEDLYGPDRSLGAKASDLYFTVKHNGNEELVSVSEAKLLRSINEAKSGKYARIQIQQLASTETIDSIDQLFDTVNFDDRIDPAKTEKRTYRQFVKELQKQGMHVELLDSNTEHTFPIIDKKTDKFRARSEGSAPGGHGVSGYWAVLRMLEPGFSATGATIAALYNEDGMNNMPDEAMVGWMAKNNVPMVMVTTTKTGLDMKGGQIGVQKAGPKYKKAILEIAQADNNGQEDLFKKVGLTEGERGAQYFNTNMALLNLSVLKPFLADLVDTIGRDAFEEVIAPDLIKEGTKDGFSYSLGGAMGSVLLNLAGYIEATNDTRIIELAKMHGLYQNGKISLLRIVNVDEASRTKFFTPLKTAFDYDIQYHSDFYQVDPQAWQLKQIGKQIPAVDLKDSWYKEVVNTQDAFKGVSLKDLTDLTIEGKVKLQNAILKGSVTIKVKGDDIVDLNAPERVSKYDLKKQNGRIVLENIVISDGGVEEVQLSARERSYEIAFGTSGWRDQLSANFTTLNVRRAAQGMASFYLDQLENRSIKDYELKKGDSLIIGYDPRKGNAEFAKEIAAVFAANGVPVKVILDEPTPTPVLAYLANSDKTVAGTVNLTASHNPAVTEEGKDGDDGIKFSAYHGGASDKEATDSISAFANEATSYKTMGYDEGVSKGLIAEVAPQDAVQKYVDGYIVPTLKEIGAWDSMVNYIKENPDFKLVLDPMQGTAVEYLRSIFGQIAQAAGRDYADLVTMIHENNKDPLFKQVNNAPNPTLATSTVDSTALTQKDKNTLALLTDGDADRFGVLDFGGNEITANDLIVLLTYFLLNEKQMTGDIGKTVASSHMIDAIVKHLREQGKTNASVKEMAVGYKYFVGDAVKNGTTYVLAGESSAHVGIKPFASSWDDGIAMVLSAFWIVAEKKMNLSQYLVQIENQLPNRFYFNEDAISITPEQKAAAQNMFDKAKEEESRNVALSKMDIAAQLRSAGVSTEIAQVNTLDGLKVVFTTGDWMLFRLSGTEFKARLYVEVTDLNRQAALREAGYKILGAKLDAGKKIDSRSDDEEEFGALYDGGLRESVKHLIGLGLFGAASEVPKADIITRFESIGKDPADRMGWAIPPAWETVKDKLSEFQNKPVVQGKDHFIIIGLGGSVNNVKATNQLVGEGKNVYTLDNLDPAQLFSILKTIGKENWKNTLIIVVSKSVKTAEMRLLAYMIRKIFVKEFGEDYDYTKNFLWMIDLPNEGEMGVEWEKADRISIQVRNEDTDVGGRFTAPHTQVFLAPVFLMFDKAMDKMERLWNAYRSELTPALVSQVRVMIDKAQASNAQRFAVVVKDPVLAEAVGIPLIQLYLESWGSKKEGFDPKVVVVAAGEKIPEGFMPLVFDLPEVRFGTVQENRLVQEMLMIYLNELFVAGIAYEKNFNFVNQPEVEKYKAMMRELEGKELPQVAQVKRAGLRAAVEERLKGKDYRFVEVVPYWDITKVAQKAMESELAGIQGIMKSTVGIGSPWNHDSLQAAMMNKDTLYVLLTKPQSAYLQEIYGVSQAELIQNQLIIAHSTEGSMFKENPDRIVILEMTDGGEFTGEQAKIAAIIDAEIDRYNSAYEGAHAEAVERATRVTGKTIWEGDQSTDMGYEIELKQLLQSVPFDVYTKLVPFGKAAVPVLEKKLSKIESQPSNAGTWKALNGLRYAIMRLSQEPSASQGAADGGVGGIDLRALPIVDQQAMIANVSALALAKMQLDHKVNLDQEWGAFEKLIADGKALPVNRVKEYLAACCQSKQAAGQAQRMATCVASMLRAEEEEVAVTAPEVKELLAYLCSVS